MKKQRQLRATSEIREALSRLQPLAGDPVVDAVIATLRWTVAEGEWEQIWGELALKHATSSLESRVGRGGDESSSSS